jgi:hypothetical protein
MKKILLDGWDTPQLHPIPPTMSHQTPNVTMIIGVRQLMWILSQVVYYV